MTTNQLKGGELMLNRVVDGGEATLEEIHKHNKLTYCKVREYETVLHGQSVTVNVYDYIDPERRSYDHDTRHLAMQKLADDMRHDRETGWVHKD